MLLRRTHIMDITMNRGLAITLILSITALGAIAGLFLYRVGRMRGELASEDRRCVIEWSAVMQKSSGSLRLPVVTECTNLNCGYGKLLRIWGFLSNVHEAYQTTKPTLVRDDVGID